MYSVYLKSPQILYTEYMSKSWNILSYIATFCIFVVFLTYHWMSMSLMDTWWNSHDKMIKDKYIILKFLKKKTTDQQTLHIYIIVYWINCAGVNSCHIVNVVRTLSLYIIKTYNLTLFSLTYRSFCPLYSFQAQHYH